MSKYVVIRDLLAQSGRETVTVSFDELAAVVPGGLPRSAFEYEAWWRDASADSTHVQSASGWLAAGYRVESLNLVAMRVAFRRTNPPLAAYCPNVRNAWGQDSLAGRQASTREMCSCLVVITGSTDSDSQPADYVQPMVQPLFRSKRAASVVEALAAQYAEQTGLAGMNQDDLFEIFAAYCLVSQYQPDFEAEELHSGGGYDLGIDAFAIKINGAVYSHPDDVRAAMRTPTVDVDIILVQAKRQRGFEGDAFTKPADSVRILLTDEPEAPKMNARIAELKQCLREVYKDPAKFKPGGEPRIAIWYASLGTFRESTHKAKINQALAKLETLDCFSEIRVYGAGAHELRELHHRARSEVKVTIRLPKRVKLEPMPGIKQSFFGVIPASEIVSQLLLDDKGTRRPFLYQDNMRDFLGVENTTVNEAIQGTLANATERARFAVLNNGITLVTRSLNRGKDRLTVKDPQIVNGCQTCNILLRNWHLLDDNVMVGIRVVESDDEEIITAIIEATNTQNELKGDDLVAREKFHRHLEDFFRSQSESRRLHYERRRNQYGTGVPRSKIVTRRMLTQGYAAMWLGVPHTVTQYQSLVRSHRSDLYQLNDDPLPYYTAAAALYRINWMLSRPAAAGIDSQLRPARYQLLHGVRLRVLGSEPLARREALVESACNRVLEAMWDPTESERLVKQLVNELQVAPPKLSQAVRTAEFTERFRESVLTLPRHRRAAA